MQTRTELVLLWRTRKGKPAREVAYLTGMTESKLSKLENGHLRVSDETIGRFVRAKLCSPTEAGEAMRLPIELDSERAA